MQYDKIYTEMPIYSSLQLMMELNRKGDYLSQLYIKLILMKENCRVITICLTAREIQFHLEYCRTIDYLIDH
jgi:hypothetical protein